MHARTVFASVVFAAAAQAQVPNLLGFQGRLLRADGTAATGTAGVTFAVFDAPSGGSQLWSETQTLGLSDGYYSTFLGLVAPPADGVFDGGTRWLEIRVGAETLQPRVRIGSVPVAVVAQSVRGGTASVTSVQIGTQTVIDANGRLAGAARYSAGAGIAVDDATQIVSLQSCPAGQTLVRDAAGWQCATPNPGTVTAVGASAPLSVTSATSTPQLALAQAGSASNGYLSSADWNAFNAKYGATTQCAGDLSGQLSAPVVARLQSRPVSTRAPASGEVLKWSAVAAQWEPAADDNAGGTVTLVTGVAPLAVNYGSSTPEISMAAADTATDGYLAATDWRRFDGKYEAATQCGGDLTGPLSGPQVAGIRGVSVATDLPTAAQVLRFDGTAWTPAGLSIGDVSGLSSGYLDLTGSQVVGGAKIFTSAPEFGTPLGLASGGTGAADAAGARTGLGLGSLATRDGVGDIQWNGDALSVAHGGTGGTDPAGARTGLGLGTLATRDGVGDTQWNGDALSVAHGGTGGTDAAGARAGLGLGALSVRDNVGNAQWSGGPQSVANGGTGAASFTPGGILFGGGSGAVGASAAGAGGQILVSGGSGAPAWTSEVAESVVTNLTADLASRPTGSGTAGYHAKWSGTGTLGSGAVYDDGANVGIGTTSPSQRLQVAGQVQSTGVRIAAAAGQNVLLAKSGDGEIMFGGDDSANLTFEVGSQISGTRAHSGVITLWGAGAGWNNTISLVPPSSSASYATVSTDGTSHLALMPGGSVGVGTDAPTSKLTVAGDVKLGTGGDARGHNFVQNYMSLGETENGAATILGNNAKATDGVNNTVEVSANADDGSSWLKMMYGEGLSFHRVAPAAVGTRFSDTAGELLRVTNSGNVGIGTTNPGYPLHVNGDAYFTGNVYAGAAGGWLSDLLFRDGDNRAPMPEYGLSGFSYVGSWAPEERNDLPVGRYAFKTTGTGALGLPRIPVDRTKTYRVEIWEKGDTGWANNYTTVYPWDQAGNNISADGTFWWYVRSGAPNPTSWTYYSWLVGPQGGRDFPSNAAYMSFGMSHPNYAGGTDTIRVCGLRMAEAPSGVGNMDVAGTLTDGAETFRNVATFPSDGAWRNIVSGLSGHQLYQVVADYAVSGYHSVGYWTAGNTYSSTFVNGNSTSYSGIPIQLQWSGSVYNMALQVRTSGSVPGAPTVTVRWKALGW